MTTLPPNQFDSGVSSTLPPDEAAALTRSHAPGAAADIPADKQRHPFGCPDPEWCRGNRLCYWHCNAEPDDISNVGEIFAGARKLEPVEMWFENTAYPREDELLYEVLLALDDPHTADLIDIPYGMEAEFDEPPLFIQQQMRA